MLMWNVSTTMSWNAILLSLLELQLHPIEDWSFLIMHQYAHARKGTSMTSTPHYRWNGKELMSMTKSAKVGRLQRLLSSDGFTFPLISDVAQPYLVMCPYTDQEWWKQQSSACDDYSWSCLGSSGPGQNELSNKQDWYNSIPSAPLDSSPCLMTKETYETILRS